MTQITDEERIIALEQHNSRMQKKLNMNSNVLAAAIGFTVVAAVVMSRNQKALHRNQTVLANNQMILGGSIIRLASTVTPPTV